MDGDKSRLQPHRVGNNIRDSRSEAILIARFDTFVSTA